MIHTLPFERIAAFQVLAAQADILFAAGRINPDQRRGLLSSARDETGMTDTRSFIGDACRRVTEEAVSDARFLSRRDRTNARRRERDRERYWAQRATSNPSLSAGC